MAVTTAHFTLTTPHVKCTSYHERFLETAALHHEMFDTFFTARRSARIASAVLAIAIPSVCLFVHPSVHLSVRLSHPGIVSKRLHVAQCSLLQSFII